MRSSWAVILFIAAILILSACDLISESGEAGVDPEPTATSDRTFLTPSGSDQPDITSEATPTPEANTLRVWIPPQIAERTETGATTLSEQISAFDINHEDVSIVVELKRARGTGGIVSYLRTGRDVAPSVLPDLVVVPTDFLATLFTEGHVHSLGDQIDAASIEALYPSAHTLAQLDDSLLGYPFALGTLPHLAYNNNVLTGTLPLTWERLIENDEHSYVFAADGTDGALLALEFYLDAGGQLVDENAQTVLDVEPLVAALQYIEAGQENGLFAPQSSSINSTDQAWQGFLGGGGNIAQTTSEYFLGQSIDGLPIAYTIIPGIDRPLTPLVDGWAWAVTASDPVKQELAADLVRELIAPQNLGAWSSNSHILPARRDALTAWPNQGPYVGFINQELERAQPLTVSTTSKLMTVLSDAVFQVVSDTKNAQQAAVDAVNAMRS